MIGSYRDHVIVGLLVVVVATAVFGVLLYTTPSPYARAADVQLLFLECERLEERIQWLERQVIREETEADWEAGEPGGKE